MNSKKISLILFSFLLLILSVSLVNAQEDFIATSVPSVELCPCSNQAYAVAIQNTGSVAKSDIPKAYQQNQGTVVAPKVKLKAQESYDQHHGNVAKSYQTNQGALAKMDIEGTIQLDKYDANQAKSEAV